MSVKVETQTHRMERIPEHTQDRVWLMQILQQIQNREMYGKVTITFEAGKIRRVQKEESLKPPHDSG